MIICTYIHIGSLDGTTDSNSSDDTFGDEDEYENLEETVF
jgi:hypothetical protein